MKNVLYKVYVETCFILSMPDDADDSEIYYEASKALQEHISMDGDSADISFTELKSVEDLPSPWEANCIPYGGDNDATIEEILKE